MGRDKPKVIKVRFPMEERELRVIALEKTIEMVKYFPYPFSDDTILHVSQKVYEWLESGKLPPVEVEQDVNE